MRETKPPMRTVTTSLREADLERLAVAARRDGVSLAAWMRTAIVRALDATDTGAGLCVCGHTEAEHDANGCTVAPCRCWKFRRDHG